MRFPLSEVEYNTLVHGPGGLYKTHGISGELSRRRSLEQDYFLHWQSKGVVLRKKYRL